MSQRQMFQARFPKLRYTAGMKWPTCVLSKGQPQSPLKRTATQSHAHHSTPCLHTAAYLHKKYGLITLKEDVTLAPPSGFLHAAVNPITAMLHNKRLHYIREFSRCNYKRLRKLVFLHTAIHALHTLIQLDIYRNNSSYASCSRVQSNLQPLRSVSFTCHHYRNAGPSKKPSSRQHPSIMSSIPLYETTLETLFGNLMHYCACIVSQ